MKWLFATTNPYKLREAAEILRPLDVQLLTLLELDQKTVEPEETGDSFEENARIKAVSYARQTGMRCIAEDSGIEVDALGGRPGVHSARYAQASGSREERDAANNQKLLAELRGVPDPERTARFVSAVCVADPDGTIIASARGTYEGVIAHAPRGQNGFGYDPLLLLPELGLTSAELTPEEKNRRSHRGKALRALLETMRHLEEAGR